MSKFKKGDRVRYTGSFLTYGIVGTVVAFEKDLTDTVGVRFDDASDSLHKLDGLCEDHHGWWALEENLELANESAKPEFNVGDLVLIVGPKDPNVVTDTDGCRWVAYSMCGSCGKVARVSSVERAARTTKYNRYKLEGFGYYYVGEWLKEYPYDKMPKFQKGDRVKITSDFSVQHGSTATVMGISCFVSKRLEYLIKLDTRGDGWAATPSDIDRFKGNGIHNVSCGDGMVYWYANETNMDLEWPERKKPKFHVGDKVIGNQKANSYSITRMGWIGTVVELSDKNIRVESADGRCRRYWVDPDCFDLVDRKTPKKTPKTPKKDPISGDAPRRVVIEITSEGAKAKYIHDGTVEEEARIHRWHGDKPDDAKAAKYAVDALFGTNKTGEDAEWASKTAKILNHMDWKDILFKAYCDKK